VAKKASAIINHRKEGVEDFIFPTALTPSPVPHRLKKTPARATLSPKGERAGI